MTSRPLKVALPWHALGHGNLGVDALSRANIAIVRSAAARAGREVEMVTLCGGDPGVQDHLPKGVSVGPNPRLKPLLVGRSDYIKVLKKSDFVLDIGEGDSWADIYGGRRFAFQAGTKLVAIALGKPLILAPQTIGPFDRPLSRRISDLVMNRALAVFTRDTLSSDYVAARKIRSESAEFIDVAFRLPFAARARDDATLRVGVNVSGLLYRGGYSGRNELGLTIDYREFTHLLIAELLQRGVEVHLVPHVGVASADEGNDNDGSIIAELRQRFPQVHVPEPFVDSSDAKSYISGLNFLIGGRMHACIGAFSSGTPVVPIAYSRKFNGLFGTLGYRHFVDGKAADTRDALAQTLSALDRRDELAADLKPGLALAAQRLDAYEAKLSEMFGAAS